MSSSQGVGSEAGEPGGAARDGASTGKRGRPLVAVAALAVIAGSAAFVWSQVDWTPSVEDRPPPARAARPPRPPGSMDVSPQSQIDVRSLLTIRKPEAGGRATAFLGKPDGPKDATGVYVSQQKLLDRELVRQAVLLAAREERGLATRDELLDGEAPPAGGPHPAEISSNFNERQTRVLARELDGKRPAGLIEPSLARKLGDGPDADDYPLRLAAILEGMTRAEFPALLDRIGGKGGPNRAVAEGAAPEGVEARLATLGLVDHFEAVRALHRSLREEGESPERLGALARAYAQLAALTAHHWSAVHRTFQARAMLYAERLAARAPDSAFALRCRAFVRTLVGVHFAAAKDLEAAAALDARAEKPAAAPGWVDVIDAALKYDSARLAAAKPPHDRLAAFLDMASVEQPPGTRLAVQSAEAVLRLDPDCGRAFDLISDGGELGDRHRSTEAAPAAFRHFFREKLAALSGLPAAVKAALGQDADDPALTAALDEAGRPDVDAGEPPWGALAQLAREARFVQVQRRLVFMSRTWGVPVDDYWDEVRPLVDGHRYRPYLGALTKDPAEARAFAEFAKTFEIGDLEPTEHDMLRLISGDGKKDPKSYWAVAEGHASRTARDLSLVIAEVPVKQTPPAEVLLRVSPRNPYAKAILIRQDWDRSQARLDEWVKSDGDQPAFQRALGFQYLDLKRFAEAREWLVRFVQRSPDRQAYEKLAACYEGEGDRKRWLATLDAYLENTEDAGLGHAQVRVRIAKYFLSQGQPERAKPYADEAAQTWAGWAMLCASEVDERLGDLDSAEAWVRNVAERYPANWEYWYRFCQRTGKGDLETSRRLARAAVRGSGLATPYGQAYFHWIEGEPDDAARVLERMRETKPDPSVESLLMLVYDQTGAAEKRDALLRKLVGDLKDQAPKSSAICSLLLGSTAAGAGPLDLEAVEAVLAETPPENRLPMRFLVARFLLNHGRAEDARRYLEACLGPDHANDWGRAAAAAWLRGLSPAAKPPGPDAKPAPSRT
ncbi:hypothetical protein [Paludisphaera mucosa]|uniref:Tetratricopeptide repeat protein n=1 Tax=Paludisphaera mucosa TaxID=3030827 RepID=A0ABT6FCG7_9BACT|nr:hypothetical protein [Paludisphaera mucosa]MDG3005201.1 hypothetical protein [Paludisphaera mucosa]